MKWLNVVIPSHKRNEIADNVIKRYVGIRDNKKSGDAEKRIKQNKAFCFQLKEKRLRAVVMPKT